MAARARASAQESFPAVKEILARRQTHHFQRHGSAECRVLGEKHLPHTAGTEQAKNSVVSQSADLTRGAWWTEKRKSCVESGRSGWLIRIQRARNVGGEIVLPIAANRRGHPQLPTPGDTE